MRMHGLNQTFAQGEDMGPAQCRRRHADRDPIADASLRSKQGLDPAATIPRIAMNWRRVMVALDIDQVEAL
jgi:hypothetical protein